MLLINGESNYCSSNIGSVIEVILSCTRTPSSPPQLARTYENQTHLAWQRNVTLTLSASVDGLLSPLSNNTAYTQHVIHMLLLIPTSTLPGGNGAVHNLH